MLIRSYSSLVAMVTNRLLCQQLAYDTMATMVVTINLTLIIYNVQLLLLLDGTTLYFVLLVNISNFSNLI